MKYLLPLALLSWAPSAWAQVTYPDRPAQRQFVVDQAKLLEADDAVQIGRLCEKTLTEKKVPIIIVTINSLKDYGAGNWKISRYAQNLFDDWEIGHEDRNNGMLILVSVKDRQARIELGDAWGGQKDAEARNIMNELIIPNFKRKDFSKGILEGVRGLSAIAMGLPAPRGSVRHRRTRGGEGFGSFFWIILVIIGIAVVGSMFRGGGYGGYGGYRSGCSPFGMGCLGGMLGSMMFGGYRSWGGGWGGGGGGGFGGFSGGSFGGGFSGGGGASGSW